jgi:SAM-dependent methyltransferase
VADPAAERLRREIEHHRRIAPRAEILWSWETPSGRVRAAHRVDLFVEHGRLAPGQRALELGCGTGIFLSQAARSGASLVGLDLTRELLAGAHARVRALSNVRLVRGDAHRTPFPDGSFDTFYGSSILHHLDLARALGESFRLLRPGGRIVFAEPNILNPQVVVMFRLAATKEYWGVSPDEMAFSRFHAARELRKAGFRAASVRPFDFVHPSLPPALLPVASGFSRFLERLPLVREIAGSLLIVARRP